MTPPGDGSIVFLLREWEAPKSSSRDRALTEASTICTDRRDVALHETDPGEQRWFWLSIRNQPTRARFLLASAAMTGAMANVNS